MVPGPRGVARIRDERLRYTVAELFVAEHGGDGVVADVVADPQSAEEQLDGKVLVDAVVDEHSVFLTSRQQYGHVAVWTMRQRR